MTDGYVVYILCCSDDTLYTGITNNLSKRVVEHNTSPKGAKYTRGRRPVKLVYHEKCMDKSSALKREWEVKRFSRVEKKGLILTTSQNSRSYPPMPA